MLVDCVLDPYGHTDEYSSSLALPLPMPVPPSNPIVEGNWMAQPHPMFFIPNYPIYLPNWISWTIPPTAYDAAPLPSAQRKRKSPQQDMPLPGDLCTIRKNNRLHEGKIVSLNVLAEISCSSFGKDSIEYMTKFFPDASEIISTALVYFELSARSKQLRKSSSIRCLWKKFLVCLIVSAKWLDDDHPENCEWSRRFSISLNCINRMERDLFEQLGYDASISQYELETMVDAIGDLFGINCLNTPLKKLK
jgi:hypothetical protein